MRPLLLLVDLQNDFLAAPGLEPASAEIVRGASRLLSGARALGVPVAHVVTAVDASSDDRMPHWRALGLWRCVRGTPGHAAPAELAPRDGEPVVEKTFFSAFSAAALEGALARAGADALVVAGVHLHGCVRATVLDAYQRGFEVWVAEDAVGSDDPLHAAVTRRYLEGRAARFDSVGSLLARIAGGPVASRPTAPLPAAVVGGEPRPAPGLDLVVHRSPRETARELFAVPVAGAGEAASAAASAREARPRWAGDSAGRRASVLREVARRLEDGAPAVAREIAGDIGKPVAQALAEVRRAAELVRRAAAAATTAGGLARCGDDAAFRRVPVGVVAAVTPWNNPVAIPLGKIAPALALGNAVVWKPAPAATRVALSVLELLRAGGVPDGLVNLVAGDHRSAAAVMSDGAVDAVSLSGSSAAGWAAQEACARRRVPLQAELGGNNAAIVWTGADLSEAASALVRGAFGFAGQRCTANRRIVAAADLFDALAARLTEATRALVWGDPLDPETEIGPLVSIASRDRVAAAVERAARQSRNVAAPHGGSARAEALREAGAYYAPTLVFEPPAASEIVQEETFGPVLVVQRAADFEEALALADGVRQGLAAALFAGLGPWWGRFSEAARAGILKANVSTADAGAAAPFGGWKGSGLGPPEHGPGNVEFYTRVQALYGAEGTWPASP